jgi:hypothetical protein
VRAHVTAGVTYSIGVDGSACCGLDLAVGTVALAWTFAPAPANDAFAAAATLSGPTGSTNGTTAGALTEPGEPQHAERAAGASVWYSWTAPATGNYRFDTSPSATPAVVGVYTGTAVGALGVVRRTDDTGTRAPSVTFAATGGTTYRIAVDGAGRAAGPFTLAWSSTSPPNNAFAKAQQIDGSNGTVESATVGATKEAGEPAHAGSAGGASVWFRWTAPLDGAVAFDTIGSDYDTLLGVYTGSSVGSLTTVAASDDAGGRTTSSVRFDATAGTTYWVAVDGKRAATGNAWLNWRPAPKPTNDDFADGELIGGRQGYAVETTVGATREPGEPDHGAAGGAHSLWFRYRAPADGTVSFSIDRSYFATALGAYTGAELGSLTSVAQGTTGLSFPVAKDAVYFVAVDGAGDAMGQFTLSWRLPPANDAFPAAQAIAGASGSVSGTTEGATPDGDGDGSSVWYRWTAPASGTWVFSVPALQYPAAVSVGVGGDFASRQAGGWWQQPNRIGVTQGVSYWIEVQPNSWTNTPGPFTLTWRQASDAPPNDGVPNAQVVAGSSGSVGGSSVGASREPGEPSIGGVGHSIWLRWTAPASGQLSVTTQGSSYSPYLAAYTGSTVANLQAVPLTTHITTGGYPGWDYIAFQAVAGTSYLLDVDSDGFGSYRVAWNLDTNGPSSGVWNDTFANATLIKDTNGSINGTNVGATKEPGEPNHAGNAGGHSVWYSWTAPASQPAGFQTACALDTLVAVYTGSSVSALSPVASNDNASSGCVGSLLSFNAVKGTTYRVAVDGKNGATGSFTLQWTGQTADVSGPTTSITGGPDGTVSSTGATFAFASEAGATFQCALDGAAFAACTSPISYQRPGARKPHVRGARDRHGREHGEPADAAHLDDRRRARQRQLRLGASDQQRRRIRPGISRRRDARERRPVPERRRDRLVHVDGAARRDRAVRRAERRRQRLHRHLARVAHAGAAAPGERRCPRPLQRGGGHHLQDRRRRIPDARLHARLAAAADERRRLLAGRPRRQQRRLERRQRRCDRRPERSATDLAARRRVDLVPVDGTCQRNAAARHARRRRVARHAARRLHEVAVQRPRPAHGAARRRRQLRRRR